MKDPVIESLRLHKLDILCGFLQHVLGSRSLIDAPILLMGYQSVAESQLLKPHRVSLINLRTLCRGMTTLPALRANAARYNDRNSRQYLIDEKSLTFKPMFDVPSLAIQEGLRHLSQPRQHGKHGQKLPSNKLPIEISVDYAGERRRYGVVGLPSDLQAPIAHSVETRRREPIRIRWSQLLDQADLMDQIDTSRGSERPGNWRKRLEAVNLEKVMTSPVPVDEIDLTGLKHLIGLPGAGKTTVLMCLLRHCEAFGIRVAMFMPSIEMCRQYLDDLRGYEVNAGLLVGQSRSTRERHALKLAESIATGDSLRGFANTTTSAPLFEGNCVLPAFTQAPSEAFGFQSRFCRDVIQVTEKSRDGKAHLCPAWSVCSLNRAPRELPTASVWLGHVLSADTKVPSHTTALDIRYFDLIAEQFDLVIFDEADQAQRDLDMSGISQLQLSGYALSFHHQAQQTTLQLLGKGVNAWLGDDSLAQLAIEAAEFEKLNICLISAVQRLPDRLRNELQGMLLTTLRIIGDWLSPPKHSGLNPDAEFRDGNARAKDALCSIWESAAIPAFQFRAATSESNETLADDELQRLAAGLRTDTETVNQLRSNLLAELARWLNAVNRQQREEQERKISELLKPYVKPSGKGDTDEVCALLIAVTFTILGYRRLSPKLAQLGEDHGFIPVAAERRCSDALLDLTPENLLGSLSGVRFFAASRGPSGGKGDLFDVRLQYVVFSGAPRALLYHLHEWCVRPDGTRDGPSVLLTSATSYLPDSPASHIASGPHYILRRASGFAAKQSSLYAFRPVETGELMGERHYRFSGVRSEHQRLSNLERMVDSLLDGRPSESQLWRDCDTFDVREGIKRRAAFVVNSYDQCRRLKTYIDQRYPAWRGRVVAVVKELPEHLGDVGYVTAARVEALGDDPNWDILIFPMGALGRGANIVFTSGPRKLDAAIGSLYFLTRPHPSPEDLSLLVSLGASATQSFDMQDFSTVTSMGSLAEKLTKARGKTYKRVGKLLRHPLYSRTLGELFKPFTADVAVILLQTIGRAMRNGCPAQCFFVDSAWAPKSAVGEDDSQNSSMLVQLRYLLEEGVSQSDATAAWLYRELFGSFLDPLRKVSGLQSKLTGKSSDTEEGDFLGTPLLNIEGE
ncbi:ATP-binding protein [Stagnimonas aquatica]|uniref:ATP-binding protein n=1 Tax=Stagnimonas aquatica TaxID=2689987 RepID=UPI0011CD62F7|nr:ATP-binding protein [Stagnimonas aquatica]